MKRVLVTGACGFAGAHIVEEILSHESTEVVSLDCLTYAGRIDRLGHLDRDRIATIFHDFSEPISESLLKQIGHVDYIIHNGAESHVLRSFKDPRIFVTSNIIGTLNILEAARKLAPQKFLYVSTDEVFGPAGKKDYKEGDQLRPTNPYAATKASGEFLTYSYFRSFGLPTIITRTMNMFGERQHPEKCVPKMIRHILRNEVVPIHSIETKSAWHAGSRRWLHARNQANALWFLLENGIAGEKYNIAGEEHNNLEIFEIISDTLERGRYQFTEPMGPVHDFTYALDDSKIRATGWQPPLDFEESLRQTVRWTAANPKWLED